MEEKVFLLADDDRDDTELFCEALASIDKNIVCRCAENGFEALSKLGEHSELPQLIFLDVNMPIMNGWQCLKQLKANEVYKPIPVIIYSTSSNQREVNTAMELGALCFFRKPDDYPQLKRSLEVIVNNIGDGLLNAIHTLKVNENLLVFDSSSQEDSQTK